MDPTRPGGRDALINPHHADGALIGHDPMNGWDQDIASHVGGTMAWSDVANQHLRCRF